MTTEVKFQKLSNLLKSNTDQLFVKNCIDSITNQKVIFNEGSVMNRDHILDLYNHRYEIQKNLTGAKVLGYRELLKTILTNVETEINVMTLITEDKSYIIFANPNLSKLLGVLQSPYSNIKKELDIQKGNSDKGILSNNQVFYRGKKV
jgi:hypothetical protein